MSEGDSFTRSGVDGTRGVVFVFSLGIAPVSVCVLTTGVVIRRRAVSGETARGGFGLGDSGAKKYILENYLKREFKSMIQLL